MTEIIENIRGVGNGRDTVASVRAVADSVANGRIVEQVRNEIGMGVVDARINCRDHHTVTSAAQIPCQRGADIVSHDATILTGVIQIPHLRK